MLLRTAKMRNVLARLCVILALLALARTAAWAGLQGNNNNSVGGISIDPMGVVNQSPKEFRESLRKDREAALKEPAADLAKPARLRMISLRALEAACTNAVKQKFGVLPPELKYLGGLQRVQYVFVLPEKKDIIIAGPAEGWRIDGNGNVVGIVSGKPLMMLDDLLIALRYVKSSKKNGISCSIDPTPEGRQRLEAFLAKQKTFQPAVIEGIEKALGEQIITLTGLPAESRMARTLVAADFRMKRYAMHLEPSPIKGMDSFVQMIAAHGGKPSNMMPRWWLANNYEPIARTEDGLAFELRGLGVKCLTEDEFISTEGAVKQSGKENPVAKKWADNFTAKYEELCEQEPVFGELRNVMDLCVVAALIEKEDLLNKAGLTLPLLAEKESELATDVGIAPRSVSTHASFLKKGREYIITASGGVQVECFDVVEKMETKPAIADNRVQAQKHEGDVWWWN